MARYIELENAYSELNKQNINKRIFVNIYSAYV